MGIVAQQSLKNTIISYVGIVLGFVTTILLYPRILSPEEYGLTRLFISLALIAAQFAHLGIKNTIIRYFPYFDEGRESRGGLLWLALIISLAGFLLFSFVYLGFQDQLAHYFSSDAALYNEYALYLLPLVFFVLFFEVLNSYYQALHDAVTGSFLNEVLVRLLTIVLLGASFWGLVSFKGFMIGFLGIYALLPVWLLLQLYRQRELRLAIPFTNGNRRLARLMSVYSGYALLGGLSTLLVGNIDLLMISALTDLSNTAVYFIAFSVGSVIAVPQRAIFKIASPLVAAFIKEKNWAKVEELYHQTSLTQIIGGCLILTGVWANLHNLMDILPPAYRGTKWIIITIGIAKLVDMATGINGGIIQNSRHYRVHLYLNGLLVLLTVATNYWLIPLYGLWGAAVATALSIFLYNTVKLIFVWRTFSMQPFDGRFLFIAALSAICLFGASCIPYLYNFWVDVSVRSMAILIVYMGSTLAFNISPDVNRLATNGWNGICHFLNA